MTTDPTTAPGVPGLPSLDQEPARDPIPLALEQEPEPGERKRKRHRKAKVEEPPPPAPVVSAEEIGRASQAFALAFRVIAMAIASKRGAHWRLEAEEEKALGDAWGTALAPYLPKIGPAVPIAGAIAVTWAIGASRLERDRELAAQVEAPTLEVVEGKGKR